MRRTLALALMPTLANAGVVYDLARRAVDPIDATLAAPAAQTTQVARYFVENGKVRVGGAAVKVAYLCVGQIVYVVESESRTVHVLKHATLSELAVHYTDAVKQLDLAAAAAPPAERDAALQKAADLKAVNERLWAPVQRDFRVTVRFESVDGHACRVWEEREGGVKRLELCIAPVASVAGAMDILRGLKTLSQFRQGSDVALGIEFGFSDWWADIAGLGGVPLLIREYKYDSLIAETMLTNMHSGVPAGSLLDLPADYHVQDGPDYVQWFVR